MHAKGQREKLIVKVLTDAGFLPETLTDDFFAAMDKRMPAAIPESDRFPESIMCSAFS